MRVWAVGELTLLGPAAKEALPRLRELMKHENETVRNAAAGLVKVIER